jgi:quinol monooxygenase YgiN
MIYVIATMNIKPGSRETLLEAAKPCIAGTRKEAGCISYDLNASLTDPNVLVFVERWETREHLGAHFNAEHLKAWRKAGADHVVSRTVEIITASGVEKL